MSIEMNTFPTPEGMAEAVATRLMALVRDKPGAVIGLATGGTPKLVYERLAHKAAPGDFARATFFALDEYVGLAPGHPCSYHYYLDHRVRAPLGLDPAQLHIQDGMAADRAGAARGYEAALAQAGGVDAWIVGIGHNGHLAFNEPGSAFDARTRDVALTAETRAANARFFEKAGDVPREAITVGIGTLREHAREVMLLARGDGKAGVLATALDGPVREEVPASVLQEMNCTLWADEAAASSLICRRA